MPLTAYDRNFGVAVPRNTYNYGNPNGINYGSPPPYNGGISYSPPAENNAGSGGFDAGMLIQFLVTLPSLKKSATTLAAVVNAVKDIPLVAPISGAVVGSIEERVNQTIAIANAVKVQLQNAASQDGAAGSFEALRKAMLLDLLPGLLGGGGFGGGGMGLILLLALSGDGGLGGIF